MARNKSLFCDNRLASQLSNLCHTLVFACSTEDNTTTEHIEIAISVCNLDMPKQPK